MSKPYLSLIIPTLNEERFLPKLLFDLRRQKEADFEVIIVDGNSSDNTASAVSQSGHDSPIRFLTLKKRNVAHQRNYGVSLALGDYLVFLDADSRVDKLFTQNITRAVRKNKSLIFIPLIAPQEKSYQDILIFKLANFFVEISQMIGQPLSSGGSMVFQKDYFRFLGGFNEKLFLSEDHEIIQRARRYGVAVSILKNLKVKVSLRRFQKEGRLDLFKKYLTVWIHHLPNGGVDKKLFEYKMGGGDYATFKKQLKTKQKIKAYFNRLKMQFEQLIQ